ncbi:hypothetical protein [Paenimyroides baculatum]|uniref:Uncharacterized protein n=1 Tax=Paenimyroides baculatum TaxID=2608000 RepID=A0A5M6CHN0_9FLAO|nr:hypothetical protein [Paenimyroides baculatum]KAA5533930.1 hypothetical protein F0460_11390 [Paenimyroides baculatum]
MKNIIYILFLIVSTNTFAQSEIVNDELFLKYEKEYLRYLNSRDAQYLQKLDEDEASFYKMFKEPKAVRSFKKNKDPLKWLEKNISKTNFTNAVQAKNNYNDLIVLKNKLNNEGKLAVELLNDLVKKYDAALIWKTLKSRLPK